MGFKCGILSLIILMFIPDSLGDSFSMTCRHQTVCALRESTVELMCSYLNINTTTGFWFSPKHKAKWRNEEHPEDLVLDSDYAGRVSYTTASSSTLTIRDLRGRDSGEYHLMLFTGTGEKYHSSTAVNLTVSDLQVKVTPDSRLQQQKSLICSTSCTLTSIQQRYHWYKNGQYLSKYTDGSKTFDVSSSDEGSYSCSVHGFNNILSPPVCVSREDCWSVKYPDRRVCAVDGSSVELPCTFSYPRNEKVMNTFWYYVRPKEEPKDLSLEEQFAGRVEYVGDKERNCALRIRDLRKSDSGEYHFRFCTTTEGGKFSGRPGVILNVTDLQVRRSSTLVPEGQTVTLICSTTCTLPNNLTYIWYRNGQPVTNKPTNHNKLYLQCSEGAGIYSCAVRGHEEHHSPAETVNNECPEERTALKHITVGVTVCLVLMLITGALCMWRRNSRSAKDQKTFRKKEHCDSTPVYDDVSVQDKTSDPSQRASDDQDSIHYASVHFKHFHTETFQLPPSTPASDTTEEQSVHYAAVNFSRHAAATQ